MPKILVLQHVAHEPLGTLDPLLRSSGLRIRYVNFGRHPDARPDLDGTQGVIMLGGPMNVDEVDRYPYLAHERDLLARAIEKNLPVLGICLGAQMIARALGSPVRRNPVKEIGWYAVSRTEAARSDPLFSQFADREQLFQWHEDTYQLPAGAVKLAESAGCPQQAFRYGERVYGFQFHLEVDEPMIERWIGVPSMEPDLELANGGVEQMRKDTRVHVKRMQDLAARTFGTFLRQQFPARRRSTILSSR